MLNSIPGEIRQQLISELRLELHDFSFTGGGCINQGGKLRTSTGSFFIKWNNARKFPNMFEAEAKGLKLLREPSVIDIPEVISFGETASLQFIVLEFVEEKVKSSAYWETLGHQLAALHRNSSDIFGLDHDNYVGSLRQVNTADTNWIEFFIEKRLQVQLKMALDKKRLSHDVIRQFEILFKKLQTLLPPENPSLLHGDLWSGNLITNSCGEPCLIDPAVYFGNREAEISFTNLFGGFSPRFYQSYFDDFPVNPGFEERVDIYNLYPLLVHVNLFGSGYSSQVVSILRQFV